MSDRNSGITGGVVIARSQAMTAEQLEELAGGANPALMDLDLDHEEIFTNLAKRVLAAEKLYDAADSLLNEIFGGNDSVDISMVEDAITAYREASK